MDYAQVISAAVLSGKRIIVGGTVNLASAREATSDVLLIGNTVNIGYNTQVVKSNNQRQTNKPGKEVSKTQHQPLQRSGSATWMYRCFQHNRTFDSWTQHRRKYKHYCCPIADCPDAGQKFAEDDIFMIHWRNSRDHHSGVVLLPSSESSMKALMAVSEKRPSVRAMESSGDDDGIDEEHDD